MAQRPPLTPGPYPSLRVRWSVQGSAEHVSALLDSGFEGHLAVPETLIDRLPAPSYVRRVRTASGEVVRVPVYVGTVELIDQPRAIEARVIALGDEYLVGIHVLNHFKVTLDHGQRVILEP